MTGFSLPDIAAFINLPASDFSTAPEPLAPPRMTPDKARRAETEALAGQDEALRQRVKELMGWDDGYRGAEEQKTVYPKKRRPLVSSARENPLMAASPLTTEILPGKVLVIPPGDKRPL